MYKLLVILFIIKIHALRNIYNHIAGKYGADTLKLTRETERIRIKIRKMKSDIKFLTTCRRNKLIPTFARPKFAIKTSIQVKRKIAMALIDAEMITKHKKLKDCKRTLKEQSMKLRETLGCVTYCNLNKTI